MELPFWRERLSDRFGIELIVPEAEEHAVVHRIIFEELCRGQVVGSSRDAYAGIITRLSGRGAEAVVLGCDVREPLFDTTALHVEAALEFAIGAPAVR
jgi:aspartate racemase